MVCHRIAWVERVQLVYAEALGQHRPDMYVLAQHGTGWGGLFSTSQALAHEVAARGLRGARAGSGPFLGALDGTAQLFTRGRSVTSVPAALNNAYTSQAAPRLAFLGGPQGDTEALRAPHGECRRGHRPRHAVRSMDPHGAHHAHITGAGVPLRAALRLLLRFGGSHVA